MNTKLIDAFNWRTWRLHAKTDGRVLTWVKWNKDAAAWRNAASQGEGASEALHQTLQNCMCGA